MPRKTSRSTRRSTTYLVYRCGANAANQGMTERMPVAIVEATSQAEATATVRLSDDHHAPSVLALDHDVTCWANQRFVAVPGSRASVRDWNSLVEAA